MKHFLSLPSALGAHIEILKHRETHVDKLGFQLLQLQWKVQSSDCGKSRCDFHSTNSSVPVLVSLHAVRQPADEAGKNRRDLLVVRKMGLHGIALLNDMHFK